MQRAVGIVRVSQVAGRVGDSFVSPTGQRERIASACESGGLELVLTIDELDVSGGTPLAKREGLRQAVEAIEAGRANVLMVAYFDRLVRSLAVQAEVVDRVEAAGGRVVALDVGEVSGATATSWLTGTFLGAVSEYYRRSVRERSGNAQARAVARGVAPWPQVPPGYLRGENGVLAADPATAPAVAEAFGMRAEGETIAVVREFLRGRGIERSYHGVQGMLASRTYLGEIHFGKLANLAAHEPIVERDVWKAAQRPPRGGRPTSDRLLARLGILRCGTCGARMVVGTHTDRGRVYPFYRCPPTGDCERRFTISAAIVEGAVVDVLRARYSDLEGRASAERRAIEDRAAVARAQADLDAAIRAFEVVGDEPAARDRLAELRRVRDEAVERASHSGGLSAALVVNLADDWERLSREAQRAIVRANFESIRVGPGRGIERLTFTLLDE